jgi:DNA-binding GntR family transcriptional regulator
VAAGDLGGVGRQIDGFTPAALGLPDAVVEIVERNEDVPFVESADEAWLDEMRRRHEDIIAFVHDNPDPQIYRLPVKELEADFHGAFIAALGNEQVTVNYPAKFPKDVPSLRLLNPDAVGPKNTVKSMRQHQEVLEAISERDEAAAVDALQRHTNGVLHRILTH